LLALKYNQNEFLPSVEELHTIKQFGFAAAILNQAAVRKLYYIRLLHIKTYQTTADFRGVALFNGFRNFDFTSTSPPPRPPPSRQYFSAALY
jgi:hypothetical protein